jgi:hypothetical protein
MTILLGVVSALVVFALSQRTETLPFILTMGGDPIRRIQTWFGVLMCFAATFGWVSGVPGQSSS